MELSDLKIFRAVVEEGGIIRAARKLHRVPSNVTTRIQQLEISIGAKLFYRDRQRLVLSPNGKSLLLYADKLLHLAEEARVAASGAAPSGVVRLGALESTSASRLPALLARYHRAFPDVRVELQTGTNDALTADVKERQIDAAFVAEEPSDTALTSMLAFREELVLISWLNHKPVSGSRDVKDDSIIAFPNGCAYRRVLERWLGVPGLATVRVLELSSYHAIIACVASGTGVALLPKSVLDVVKANDVMQHRLPQVFAKVTTPLIWRSAEATLAVNELRELLVVEREGLTKLRRDKSVVLSRSRRNRSA